MIVRYMIRFLVEVLSACLNLEAKLCEYFVGSICGFTLKAYCVLAVLHFVRNNVIAYFDRPSLHVYQFFHGDVTLRLIYQN